MRLSLLEEDLKLRIEDELRAELRTSAAKGQAVAVGDRTRSWSDNQHDEEALLARSGERVALPSRSSTIFPEKPIKYAETGEIRRECDYPHLTSSVAQPEQPEFLRSGEHTYVRLDTIRPSMLAPAAPPSVRPSSPVPPSSSPSYFPPGRYSSSIPAVFNPDDSIALGNVAYSTPPPPVVVEGRAKRSTLLILVAAAATMVASIGAITTSTQSSSHHAARDTSAHATAGSNANANANANATGATCGSEANDVTELTELSVPSVDVKPAAVLAQPASSWPAWRRPRGVNGVVINDGKVVAPDPVITAAPVVAAASPPVAAVAEAPAVAPAVQPAPAASLDQAARTAKMLRDQLGSSVR